MAIALLFGLFAILLAVGLPVAFALAAASLATLIHLDLPTIVLAQQTAAGAGTSSLIARSRCSSLPARSCSAAVCPNA